MGVPVAIQLYTLREETAKDFVKALEFVAEQGYQGVEFAGFGNVKAEDMKAHLDRIGLKVAGSHTSYDLLLNHLDEVIAYNKVIGNKNITCPGVKMDTKEEIDEVINNFKVIAKKLKEHGMILSFHNHYAEFRKIDGEYIHDILYTSIPAEDFEMELDTFWISFAGVNVCEYLRQYKGRAKLVHLKDGLLNVSEPALRAIGEGDMDIQAVIDTANEIGAEWLVVENDMPSPTGFEDCARSMHNLKTKFKV